MVNESDEVLFHGREGLYANQEKIEENFKREKHPKKDWKKKRN
jgi:hypothetical protein